MHILSVLLLGVATNLDNLIIGMSMGFQGKRISPAQNGVIAALSAAAAFVCCYVSSLCAAVGRIPNILGGVLLILLGAGPLMIHRKPHTQEEGCPAKPGGPGALSWRETVVLGLALAANCLATAFAAGMTGLGPVPIALVTGGFSLLCVGVGNLLGCRGSRLVSGPWLERAAAVLLILIGVWEIGV